jgi:hypothetical protein
MKYYYHSKIYLSIIIFYLIGLKLLANDFGNGSDGSLLVPETVYTDIIKTVMSQTSNAGEPIVYIENDDGFQEGQLILIIQMLGDSAGIYEEAEIVTVNSGWLLVAENLVHTYVNDDTNKAQVLKINQYTNVTLYSSGVLTCSDWNGETGGIICFKVSEDLNVNGSINASGKGYIGSNGSAGGSGGTGGLGGLGGSCETSKHGGNGEFGTGSGEGGDRTPDSWGESYMGGYGGAGGAYGNNGTTGGLADIPIGVGYNGAIATNVSSSNFSPFLRCGSGGRGSQGGAGGTGAGGGGGGGRHYGCINGSDGSSGSFGGSGGPGGPGGAGGGIIYIHCNTLSGDGSFISNGENGSTGDVGMVGQAGGSGGNGSSHFSGSNGGGGGGGDGASGGSGG